MHERAIAEGIVATVLEHTGTDQVTVVRMRIGALAGVVVATLDRCFDVATAGTTLEGARLEVEDIAGSGHCPVCGADFAILDPALPCGRCGSADVEMLTGGELTVGSVEVVG